MPGVRLNISKSGISTTIGPRGASVGIGKRGAFLNLGIPGTGLSYRQRLSSGALSKRIYSSKTHTQLTSEMSDEYIQSVSFDFNDKGDVVFVDEFGFELDKKQSEIVRLNRINDFYEWMKEVVSSQRDTNISLYEIHKLTPCADSLPDFSTVKFMIRAPISPIPPKFPPRPVEPEKVKGGISSFILPNKRRQLEEQKRQLEQEYQIALAEWEEDKSAITELYDRDMREWENNFRIWREAKKEFQDTLLMIKNNFESGSNDKAILEAALSIELQRIEWPRETMCSFEVQEGGATVVIDVDLPEIEDMPEKEIVFSKNYMPKIKEKSGKQIREEYAYHIHGVAEKIAGHIFSVMQNCTLVIISGYSQRIDKSLGKISDEYLYSIKFDRENFSKIDFKNADPIAIFSLFEHKRKMTKTGIFTPITPY